MGNALSWIGLTKDPAEVAAEKAAAAKVANDKTNAIDLANYRQTSRNQYHNLLTDETAPYQSYSDRLASMYGTGMSTAGLSASENPVTLQDTGVGAPLGSNYVGWYSAGDDPNSVYATPHDAGSGATRHVGIRDYLNGTAPSSVDAVGPDGNALRTMSGPNTWVLDGPGHVDVGNGYDYYNVSATPDALAAAGLDANGKALPGQGPVTSAPRLTSPGPQGPAASLSFVPRQQQ